MREVSYVLRAQVTASGIIPTSQSGNIVAFHNNPFPRRLRWVCKWGESNPCLHDVVLVDAANGLVLKESGVGDVQARTIGGQCHGEWVGAGRQRGNTLAAVGIDDNDSPGARIHH